MSSLQIANILKTLVTWSINFY